MRFILGANAIVTAQLRIASLLLASIAMGCVMKVELGPDGRPLFATQPAAGKVPPIDRTNGQVLRTFSVGGNPRRVAFDRSTGWAVVSNEAGWLDYLP